MTAIVAAAVAPAIPVLAIAQKGPTMDWAPIIPTLIPTITSQGILKYAAIPSATAPSKPDNAVCQRRSPEESECRPTTTIATAVSRYGIAATTPVIRFPIPDRARITLGSHSVTPYMVEATP